MANEGLQYDLSVNFSDYEKSLSKYLSSTIDTNKKVEKSYEEVDKSVDKLSATQKKEHDAIVKQGAERRANAAKLMDSSRKRAAEAKAAADKIVRAEKKIADAATMTALKIKNLEDRNKKLALQTEKARLQNEKLVTSLNKTTKTSSNLSKTVKTLAGAYLGFAAARKLLNASFQLGGKILDESGQLETATEKWRIFKGSADEASTTINDLFEFSNRTPFTFKDVNAAATQLYVLTDGALQGSKAMEQMGDRAAMAKVPMSQLTTWWGRLYAGMQSGKPIGRALTRMQQLGIVSGTLRNKLDSLSKADMMSGKGWEMFIEGTSKPISMISELAKTIEGKKSTLSGVWDGLFALKGENLNVAKDQLDNIIKALNDNKGLIQDFFSFSLEVFSKSVNGAMSLIKGYMNYVDKARNYFNGSGAGYELNKREDKYKGQSNVSLSRTSASLGLQASATKASIGNLKQRMAWKYGAEDTNEMEKGVIAGHREKMFEKDEVAKMRELYKKLNDIQSDRLAVNAIILKQETKIASGQPLTVADGFTGVVSNGTTGKSKYRASKDPLLEKMFPDSGGDPEDYELLSVLSNYSAGGFKTRKGNNNIYKEDADRRLAIITDGWTRSMEIQEDTSQQMVDQQKQFYSDSISILDSSNSTIIGFHEAFTSGNASGILGGLGGAATGLSGILGTLGLVDPSGISGILGGVLGIGSTIAGFFGGSDSDTTSSYEPETSVASRANIVNSGPETLIVETTVNVSGYVDKVTISEIFENEISPLINDNITGALA